jgi:hypothetical protein
MPIHADDQMLQGAPCRQSAMLVDKGGKREVKVVASGLYRPNGIVMHKGTLYIAELSQISKIENVEDKLDNPPKPTVIFSDLPKDEAVHEVAPRAGLAARQMHLQDT